MRVCVFVDGENLRHTICDLFPEFDQQDYLPKNADWRTLFDNIVQDATGGRGERLRTYWYVVQHFDPFPRPLARHNRVTEQLNDWARKNAKRLQEGGYTIPAAEPDRTKVLTEIQEDLSKAHNNIRSRFEGWTTLQNGIAHKHRSVEFRRSGAISYNLIRNRFGLEKTVDVNLAVDMVTLHPNYDVAIIISGDQDYVPAAQAVKNLGKSVVNVAFLARSGLLLPGGAARLNQITDWSISLDWAPLRQALAIGMETT
jgi:uncharacterized LabA/DUF88 family protein